MKSKLQQRKRRHSRIKKVLIPKNDRLRLIVYRSLTHIYAQLVDDSVSKTVLSASDFEVKGKGTKKEKAKEVGKILAKRAMEKNISECKFDRAGYKYHGRVKELAEGAREGGLKF